MGQTLRPVLPLLLFSAAIPGFAQQNCPSATLVPSKSYFDQAVAFLANQKVSMAGQLIGLVGKFKESPKLSAIGDVIGLAYQFADYMQKHNGTSDRSIALCPAGSGVTSPFGSPFSILGTRSDIQTLMGNGWNSSISKLLRPYQSTSPAIPGFTFPNLANQLGSTFGNAPSSDQPGQNLPPGSKLQNPPWLNPMAPPKQANLSGTVLNEHGNPVSGAIVSLVASFITTAQPQWRMTFEDGSYSFADAPGAYSISARLSSRGGELRSDSQLVNLSADNPSRINLCLLRPAATTIAEVGPEQKSMIIDFIAAADRSQTRAAFDGDSSYLERHFAGRALAMVRQHFDNNRRSATVSRLESGQVQRIHYNPADLQIEVDTVEVWSHIAYDPRTGREISRQTGRQEPQSITIQQTPDGWYITNVQFHN
jgi:hypothetical protein